MATRGMSEFRVDGVDYTINDPNNAPEFDASVKNEKDEYIYYQGDLYRFDAPHSANTAWSNRSKTKVKLGEELKNKVPNTRKVNGHALTDDININKSDVGLGNVDNTSDANKPVSTAQAAAISSAVAAEAAARDAAVDQLGDALVTEAAARAAADQSLEDTKVPKTTKVNGHALSSDVTVTKSDVGLGNVDNTSDVNKPVSTAQQAAIDELKSALPQTYDSIENEFEQITGNRALVFRSGRYITASTTGIGDLVSYNENTGYVCAICPCVEGDEFYVNVKGYTGNCRAYFFCDANMICKRRADANTLVNYKITAHEGEAFVVFTNRLSAMPSGYYVYKGESLISKYNASENATIRYRKQLSSSDDLDQLFDIGVYVAISSSLPINSPTINTFVLSIFGSPINGAGNRKTAILTNQNGATWIRSVKDGTWGEWEQIAKQADTDYLKSGLSDYINGILPITDNLVKGDRLTNGKINKSGIGISTKEFYYLNKETIITVSVKDGWIYSVLQGNKTDKLEETHHLVNDQIIVTKRKYVCFTFYKTESGEPVNTELSDYTGQITLEFHLASGAYDLVHDVPENEGTANLIKRAYQMTMINYEALADIPFYGSRVMAEGSTRNGIPYSSVRPENLYVPQSVGFEAFMTALLNPNSYVYTKELDIPNYYGHTYYGSVCSAFVAWCYQIEDVIPTTISFSHYDGFNELPSDQQNWKYIKLGDMLNKPGSHIVIVTDILRNRFGEIAYIELSEETDAVNAVARSKLYTRDIIQTRYNQGYRIYRYDYIADIEYTPTPWVHVEPFETEEPIVNANIISRRGNKVNYPAGDTVVIDIIEQGSYTGYALENIGAGETTTGSISGATISLASLDPGQYRLRLTGDGNSDYIYFDVISTVGTKYETQASRKVKVTPSTTLGTPSSVIFCGSNPGKSAFMAVTDFHVFTAEEIAQGYAIVNAPATDSDNAPGDVWYMRCMYKTEYGLYSGSFCSVPVSTSGHTVTESAYQQSEYIVDYPTP